MKMMMIIIIIVAIIITATIIMKVSSVMLEIKDTVFRSTLSASFCSYDSCVSYHKTVYMNIETSHLRFEDLSQIRYHYKEEKGNYATFDKNIFNVMDFTNVEGYLQNEKYFTDIENQIRKEYSFNLTRYANYYTSSKYKQ